MPTFLPGCMRVPRWRTIILPARIYLEPNILTPSRLDSESRPLRDEPPAFLCAIYIAFIPQWKPFHYRLCRCAVLYSSADGRRVFGNVCGGAAYRFCLWEDARVLPLWL